MELGACFSVHPVLRHVSLVWWRHILPALQKTVSERNTKALILRGENDLLNINFFTIKILLDITTKWYLFIVWVKITQH